MKSYHVITNALYYAKQTIKWFTITTLSSLLVATAWAMAYTLVNEREGCIAASQFKEVFTTTNHLANYYEADTKRLVFAGRYYYITSGVVSWRACPVLGHTEW